jgi:alpha-beta hydrolase superfamily lysophospholipase
MSKLGIAALVGLPVVAAGVYAGVSIYGANQVTNRKRLLPQVPPDAIAPRYEDVSFPSREDAFLLRGWWYPVQGGTRALILVHGHGQNRIDQNWGTVEIGRAFHERGYAVLVFDLRGHGESASSRQSYGVREKNDVLGAFDFVCSRGFAPRQVAIAGVSYGGSSTLTALPALREASAIVSDSAFALAWPVIDAQIPKQSPIFARLQPGAGIRLMAKLLFGIDLSAARPVDGVAAVPERPILFIHGTADDYVVPENVQQLFSASRSPESQLWLVPGAHHAGTYQTAPDEFIRRVATFLDAQLSAAEQARPTNGASGADATARPLRAGP